MNGLKVGKAHYKIIEWLEGLLCKSTFYIMAIVLNICSVDLIVTDPPYNLGKFMENRDTNLGKMRDNFFGVAGWDDLDFKEWKQSMNKFFHQAARVLKDGAQ